MCYRCHVLRDTDTYEHATGCVCVCVCVQIYAGCGVRLNSLLAVPIRSGIRVIGIIIMINGKNEMFTDRDKTSIEVCQRSTTHRVVLTQVDSQSRANPVHFPRSVSAGIHVTH